MSKDTKDGQSDVSPANPEEIRDDALDQAEGGFALSSMFTKTVKAPTRDFSEFNIKGTVKIDTPDPNLEDVNAEFIRKRPGRKSF
ncbi:MAG: hypothetical protein AAGD13_20130 [Pseudomonadota bacterium]